MEEIKVSELNPEELEEVAGGAVKQPAGGSKDPLPEKSGCKVYRIMPGDTLTAIAKKNNTTPAKIVAVNDTIRNPNSIRAGYYIYIPV